MTQQAHLSDAFSLANGVAIPCLGYGTWRMQDGAETVAAIQTALSLGYRHIDTAAYYRNEASVGQALRASGLPREAVFLTSKVWNTDRGYAPTKAAFQATLDRLGTDYLDLYPHPLARCRQPVRRLGGHQPGHLAGHDGALPGGEDPGHRRVQLPPPTT